MSCAVNLTRIGTLCTPHQQVIGMPVQPVGAKDIEGVAELFPEYVIGLTGLEGFSHVILLYHLHQVKSARILVTPFMDTIEHGVFATRAPCRPSAIGLSIVRVKAVKNGCLTFFGADMLNGSPLLDIKPFFAQVDNQPDAISGWLDRQPADCAETRSADNRFAGAVTVL